MKFQHIMKILLNFQYKFVKLIEAVLIFFPVFFLVCKLNRIIKPVNTSVVAVIVGHATTIEAKVENRF